MGIIRNGILGGFRKKVGNISGAFFRNLNVIKTLPRPSGKPATQLQINQRIKFGLVTSFLSSLSDLIEVGYDPNVGSASPMNQAVSYHLREAVIGVAPDFSIDFTKVRFSNGKVILPIVYAVEAVVGGLVKFSWTDDGIDNKHKDGADMINLLVYNPELDRFITMMKAAPRSAKEFSMQLSPDMVGTEVHCYFNFSSAKKKNSKSVYVGITEVE